MVNHRRRGVISARKCANAAKIALTKTLFSALISKCLFFTVIFIGLLKQKLLKKRMNIAIKKNLNPGNSPKFMTTQIKNRQHT